MNISKSAVSAAALAILASPMTVGIAPAADAASIYRNCTALHHKYHHGVGRRHAHDRTRSGTNPVTNFTRNTRVYRAAMNFNSDLDRDRDGIACETH